MVHLCTIPEAFQVFLRKPRNMARLQTIKQKYHVQIHMPVPRRPVRRPVRPVQKGTPPTNANGVADDPSHQPASELSHGEPTTASESDATIGTLTNGEQVNVIANVNGEGDHSASVGVSSECGPQADEAAIAPNASPDVPASPPPVDADPSSSSSSTPVAAIEGDGAAAVSGQEEKEKADENQATQEQMQAQARDPEQDIVRIVGQPESVLKAEEELRALLPVVVRVPVPAEFQPQMFAGRGRTGPQFWRQLEHSHDIVVHPVAISGPPPEGSALHAAVTDDSDVTQFAILRGVREDIDAATKEIEARLAECVKQKEDFVRCFKCRLFCYLFTNVPQLFICSSDL